MRQKNNDTATTVWQGGFPFSESRVLWFARVTSPVLTLASALPLAPPSMLPRSMVFTAAIKLNYSPYQNYTFNKLTPPPL